MTSKKVLITGCNGFIGSKIAQYYLDKQYSVYGIDVPFSININSDITMYYSNLELDNMVDVYKSVSPDLFIHCAGNANVSISVSNPELDFNRNVGVLYKTLSELKKAEINSKFIFLSSAAVYGNPSMLPVTENSPRVPISPYGLHKKMCEDLCLYYNQQFNTNIKILRIFSAYGEGLKKQIMWDMHKKINQTGRLDLFGTGLETRDFIHIDDVIEAIDLIWRTSDDNVIYNIGCGNEISIKRLADIFANHYEIDKDKVTFNGLVKEGDPLNWKADITNIRRLGFERKVNIEDGVAKYIHWAKGEKNG